jgi:hypothetical protein
MLDALGQLIDGSLIAERPAEAGLSAGLVCSLLGAESVGNDSVFVVGFTLF